MHGVATRWATKLTIGVLSVVCSTAACGDDPGGSPAGQANGGDAGEAGHAGMNDGGDATDRGGGRSGGNPGRGGSSGAAGARPDAGAAGDDDGAGSGGRGRDPVGGDAGSGPEDGGSGGEGSDAECGDGIVEGSEGCDDRNSSSGDGCHLCRVEPGFTCDGTVPSACRPTIVSIAAGRAHTCIAMGTGKVACWGFGSFGQLGSLDWRSIGDDETPASAGTVDVGETVEAVAAGGDVSCALLPSGKIRCWGDAYFGQLGYGNTNNIGDDETPASAGDVDVGGSVKQLAVGGWHVCALLTTGRVRCWGDGQHGALGYGNTNNIGDDETPASAGDVEVGGTVQQIAAGERHTCALLASGSVRCWGEGLYAALGYGDTENVGDDETPASAGDVEIGGIARQLAASYVQTCALMSNDRVRCWGGPPLGYGNLEVIGDDESPSTAGDLEIGGAVREIAAAGWPHTCALMSTNSVRCWGYATEGRLGYGNNESIGDDEVPATAGDVIVGGEVRLLAVGDEHVCVVLQGSRLRCWGRGEHGQLGYGNTHNIGDNEPPASAGDVQYY